MTQFVFDFTQGDEDQKDLLGGKGANLAEMTRFGSARTARVHHHHRGLPRIPGTRHRACGRCERPGTTVRAGHDGPRPHTRAARCMTRSRPIQLP